MKNRDNYWRFILGKEQWTDWLLVFACTLAGCLLIRHFYPWPALVNDSYDYLSMAREHSFVPVRPLGYSYFLRLIGIFSHAPGSILIAQGIVYALSIGVLLLAVKKYWPPRRKWAFRVLEAVAVLSPASLYLLNSVLSDALFCCLVFVMLAMAIVLIKEQSWVALGIYLATFYAALFVRHSAEFFPLAFIPVFLAWGKPLMRILSSVLTLVVLVLFCLQMRGLMYENTGYRQVSTGFEGWQLANNAIHVLPYVDTLTTEQLPDNEETAFIHQYLQGSFIWYINRATDNGKHVTADFMWDPNGPLRQTLQACVIAYERPQLKVWVDLGTNSLKDYGIWLMLKYPKEFIRYYLWPNIKSAFYPYSAEAVFTYIDSHPGDENAVGWFGIPEDLSMKPRSNWLSDTVQPVLSWIELLTWLIFLFGGIVYLLGGRGAPRTDALILLMVFLFGFIYYGTTVFASPIALRYWMPMHTVKLAFAWMAVRPEFWARIRSRLDRLSWMSRTVSSENIRRSAMVFIALPLLAFFVGFLRWYYALLAVAALMAALYFILRPDGRTDRTASPAAYSWKVILAAFLTAMVWSHFGGMDGYWYQTSDWDCRNAIFFDLIRYDWPVIYSENGGSLVYYIGHWLPPAALAKVVMLISGSTDAGLMAGRIFLWLWTSVGLTVILLLLFQALKAVGRKKLFFATLLFILFSGMDLLGAVLEKTLEIMMLPLAKPSGPHLEWWMQFRYQFSSNTTLLYWVFNQTIVAWMVTLLFLQDRSPCNFVFYGVACLFCAPMACVGLAVLMLVKVLTYCIKKRKDFIGILENVFSIQNLFSLFVLFIPVSAYLLSANAVGSDAASVGGRPDISFFSKDYLFDGKFLLFILLEVGVYLLLISPDHYKNPLYYVLWASFLVFPYFHIGQSLDFCMRATIPALFVLMVYAGRFLMAHFRERGWKKVCAWALLVCLVIGTATPAVEIYRGFYYTGKLQKVHLEDRSIMTFNDGEARYNFVTADPQNHFFFKHLAKQKDLGE